MVDTASRVIVLSNDIVPGMGMPVAAPGLRAFGLAEGLKAHGFAVTIVVPSSIVDRQASQYFKNIPPPRTIGIEVVQPPLIAGFLKHQAPATVILINSNWIRSLRRNRKLRYIIDFFAPKLLELSYRSSDRYPIEELAELRKRKLEAIDLADGFIVNGVKKRAYFLAWFLQTNRDIRKLPYETVNMCVPTVDFEKVHKKKGLRLRIAMAGYFQPWMRFGGWLDVIHHELKENRIDFHLLMPNHWGSNKFDNPDALKLEKLYNNHLTVVKQTMLFRDFQEFLSGMDLVIDLFAHSYEREYAMVTRTIVALACGVPVIHPPFTEVSPLITEYNAGWLIDPEDEGSLSELLQSLRNNPLELDIKTKNTRRLARERIEPAAVVEPLAKMIRSLAGKPSVA